MCVQSKSLVVGVTVVLSGAALVVACSGSDAPSPSSPAGSAGNESGVVSSSGESVDNPGATDSGVSSSSGDGGQSSSGGDAGGNKPIGATCTTQSDTSTECESGICRTQGTGGGGGGGGGGGTTGTFCTVKCDMFNSDNDPKCAGGGPLSGRCSGKGYCQVVK